MPDEDNPDLDDAIERMHRRWRYCSGRGWPDVEAGLDHAASTSGHLPGWRERDIRGGGDGRPIAVGYVFETERFEANLSGLDGPTTGAVRFTMIFRMEGGAWKVVHRPADPLTEPQLVDRALKDPS